MSNKNQSVYVVIHIYPVGFDGYEQTSFKIYSTEEKAKEAVRVGKEKGYGSYDYEEHAVE